MLNLLTLALAWIVVRAFLEYRIRKYQSLLRVSLLEIVLLITFISMITIWFVAEVDRARQQFENSQRIEAAFGPLHVTRTNNTFPNTISRLLDHRVNELHGLPFVLFQPAQNVVLVSDNPVVFDNEEQFTTLVESFDQYSETWDLYLQADRQTIKFLNAIDQSKIERLGLNFADDKTGKPFVDPDGFVNELKARFPNLELLRIKLSSRVDQREQLKPFLIFHDLKQVCFEGLSMEGANFILNSAWSHETEMVVSRRRYYTPGSYDHTEAEAREIRERLRKRFRVRSGSAYW